jgi:hypothetical protein
MDRLVFLADRFRVGELLVLASAAVFYGFNAFRYAFPVGAAGLFSLMTETVAQNKFALPDRIPFYGPGGIPFAYPPLGPYLAAFFVSVLRVPLMGYLRFAPPVFGLLSLVALYFLAWRILGDRHKALVAAALVATMAIVYDYHATAWGMVRGPAFLFALAGLLSAWDALGGVGRVGWKIALAGVCLGLTTLTHLSYTLFFGLSVAVFCLMISRERFRVRLARSAAIAAVGLAVAAPWLLTIVTRHGVGVFVQALSTHGGLGVFRAYFQGWRFLPAIVRFTISSVGSGWDSVPLIGLFLAAVMDAWIRGKWLIPVWFVGVLFLIGEADRFLVVLACLLVAQMIVDLARRSMPAARGERASVLWHGVVPVTLILAFTYWSGFRVVRSFSPSIGQDTLALASWMRTSTPDDATFLVASDDDALIEWIPDLARRTPLLSPWGGEWIGTYGSQSELLGRVGACMGEPSFTCMANLMKSANLDPDYLIAPSSATASIQTLSADPSWQPVFENAGFDVFKRLR